MRRLRCLAGAFAVASLPIIACSGGGGGSTSPPPSSGPTPPPTSPANPCPTGLAAPSGAAPAAFWDDKRSPLFGDAGWTHLDALWTHTVAQEQTRIRAETEGALPQPYDEDIGDIAIIQDVGDLILPSNQFDLRGRGLRFTPNGGGGYDVAVIDQTMRSGLGSRVALEDDDARAATVPFGFPLFGKTETAAFVNSDGNITFGEADTASTARNVTRFLSGPPRIATFFADLDPSTGGQVFVNAGADAFVVTYCSVRAFESQQAGTFQTALLPGGTIEMRFFETTNLPSAVIGLSPGATSQFSPVNLTDGSVSTGPGAVGERFSEESELDIAGVSQRFLSSHPDAFDQLMIWTDTRVVTDAFAFETTIRNDIRGLGVGLFDASRSYGASGTLSSIVVMDALSKYPDDPERTFLGENNTVSVVGQETGHRWLVFVEFRDQAGRPSDALLGRDAAHWGFFVDSDASVMEGNDIEDLGGGSFRTVGAVRRFSLFDQYAMGLVGESEVPPIFYVENPRNVQPPVSGSDAAPRIGVTFEGTRRDVAIGDITAVVGSRRPTAAESPKTHRQAFIYVVGRGRQADPAAVGKLDRIRRAWGDFYERAVDGRGRVETHLR